MNWQDLVEPAEYKVQSIGKMHLSDRLISQVCFFQKGETYILSDYNVVVIGFCNNVRYVDERNFVANKMRSMLYGLSKIDGLKVLDLGNLLGKTLNDRYVALECVLKMILQERIIPIVIGGGDENSWYIARQLSGLYSEVNVGIVDAVIDWEVGSDEFYSENYIGRFKALNNIESLSVFGVQNYYCGVSQLQKLKELDYDCVRLKDVVESDGVNVEPLIRDCDMLSFDLCALENSVVSDIKSSNGIPSNIACRLSWYAGMSDKMKSLAISECDFVLSESEKLKYCSNGAQIIWHFLYGVTNRKGEYPVQSISNYQTYIVRSDSFDYPIEFYHSHLTDRWWMSVEDGQGLKKVIACLKRDYDDASSGNLPERWWKIFDKKNNKL